LKNEDFDALGLEAIDILKVVATPYNCHYASTFSEH